jgi:cytochrome c
VGAALVFALFAAAAPAAKALDGERAFQRCVSCHSMDPREAGLQGPTLAGVVGRRAGSVGGFEYSPAMRQARARGLVWTEAALDRFMLDPQTVVPKTDMFIPAVRDPRERAAVIAYLKGKGARR